MIALLCACVMLIGTFAGCGTGGDDPAESTAPSDVQSEEEIPTETKNDKDELGEHDFEKQQFNILARESTLYEYDVEFTADISQVGKEVYERNEIIEERFNVTLQVTPTAGDNADRTAFTTLMSNAIASGTTSYHMASAHGTVISPQQFQGHCIDLHKLP